jgi:orotate phosphoribosyltransferase
MSFNTSSNVSLIKRVKDIAYLEGDFTTRSGKKTSYYIDKYLLETDPFLLDELTDHLLHLFPEKSEYDRIAAPELGAVPLASVLSVKLKKPFVIVRKEGKEYGTSNLIEGKIKAGDRVVLVEDVLTTGGAAIRACSILQSQLINIVRVVGVINREEGAHEAIVDQGWEVTSLITSTDLRSC